MANLGGINNPFFDDDDDEFPVEKVVESPIPAEDNSFNLPEIPTDTLSSGDYFNTSDSKPTALPEMEEPSLPTMLDALGGLEVEEEAEESKPYGMPTGDILEDYESPVDTFETVSEEELEDGEAEEPDGADSLESILSGMVQIDEEPNDTEDDYLSYFEDMTEEDILQGFDLDAIISDAIDMGASDIHITADDHVAFTYLGEVERQPNYPIPSYSITSRLQVDITSSVLEEAFAKDLELDTSYVLRGGKHKGRRTRLSIGRSFGNVFLVFRVIADQVPTPEELGIVGGLADWVKLPNGLVMLNGPTGSGKSTSIASLIKRIQLERAQKIITLERPVEFIYGVEGKALVTQREIGLDARSFAAALTSALRQAPDIIVVGEVRNRIEVNELLRAAETGHLAISTMHTNSAAATLNRIKSLYEGDDQLRILATLGDITRGFANQVLVKTVDGKSRRAVREVLEVNREVRALISKGDVRGLRDYQEAREMTMEHELIRAVRSGVCTVETAAQHAPDPHLFKELLSKKF